VWKMPKIPGIPGVPGQQEEERKPLPAYRVEKKNKVFYVCEVCGEEFKCKVKDVRALIEAQEKAGKGVEDIGKGAVMAATGIFSTFGVWKMGRGVVKLASGAGKGIISLGTEQKIRQDALKNMMFCPSCQRWVCKANCWVKQKGMCIACVNQQEEEKRERREAMQVIKARNFCQFCGAKITDPNQIRCSNCGALLQ